MTQPQRSQETIRPALTEKGGLPATIIALTVLGLLQVAAVEAQSIPTPPGMRKELIYDPVLTMDAYMVFIPAKWSMAGTIVQGTTCNTSPFPVFRASSPDTLSALERLPRFDWMWGNNPAMATKQNDCLPLKTAMSARDFLKYLSAAMKLEYLGEEPVPGNLVALNKQSMERAKAEIAPKYAASGMTPPTETIDLARAIVRTRNGSFVLKGMLSATVDCMESQVHANPRMQPWVTHTCNAIVRYVRGPEAQFQAVNTLLDPMTTGSAEIQTWIKAWMDFSARQTAANIRQIQARGQAETARIQANGEQFRHSQEVRQRMHDDFMATMQRGHEMFMNRQKENMEARDKSTSDWVDFALDRQTVRDPTTGQITKVSNTYTYIWINQSGQIYETQNGGFDPNRVLAGTWTLQQKVHGNGTQ